MTPNPREDLSITERAAEWYETLDDAAPQQRAAFLAWLKESPRHVGEFLAVATVCREFSQFDPARRIDIDALIAQASPTVVPIGEPETRPRSLPPTRSHGWVFRTAAAIIAIAAAGWVLTAQPGAERYETKTGEQRSIKLPDGSLVFLNARSILTVRFSENTRNLRLLSGEALFNVARDARRPFRVDIGNASVQAVGTQFNIYRRADTTTVSVLEGRVRFSDRTDAAALSGGQETSIAADGQLSPVTPLNEVKVTAWRQRQLVFRSERLADVAAEFNRYNQSPQIRIEGEAARERRLTGIFNADDPESLILFLRDSDLAVLQTPGEVVIQPR